MPGHFDVDNAIRESGLPPHQRLVLYAMATYVGPDGLCWPSVERLVHDTGFKRRMVQKALSALRSSGQIMAIHDPSHKATTYRLSVSEGAHPSAHVQPSARRTPVRGGGAMECAGGRTPVREGAHPSAPKQPRTTSELPEEQEGEGLDAQAPKSVSAPKAPDPSPDLPAVLDTPAFRAAWAEYIAYRHDRHLPKLLAKSIAAQWRKMKDWGEPGAIEAIQTTIANGWQGIFPPKGTNGNVPYRSNPAEQRRAAKRATEYDEPMDPPPIIRIGVG